MIAVAVATATVLLTLGASAPTRAASGWNTLTGFNNVRPVFKRNGFPNYQATYVRCYPDSEWRKVRRGHSGLMGWYDGGVWIHVRASTCTNSAKALRGETSNTNVVALSTVIHEAIHRQGIRSESTTECLATWLAAHAVLAWTGSEAKALRTLSMTRTFARSRLPGQYQTTNEECVAVAVGFGIRPIRGGDPPADTVPTPSPPPPAPPPPPAEYLIGYQVDRYVNLSSRDVPATHRIVIIAYSTVGPYDIRLSMSGQSGTVGGTYRVNGKSELRFDLPAGWPSLGSGPSILVSASPDFTWSSQNPGQSKIELRVLTQR